MDLLTEREQSFLMMGLYLGELTEDQTEKAADALTAARRSYSSVTPWDLLVEWGYLNRQQANEIFKHTLIEEGLIEEDGSAAGLPIGTNTTESEEDGKSGQGESSPEHPPLPDEGIPAPPDTQKKLPVLKKTQSRLKASRSRSRQSLLPLLLMVLVIVAGTTGYFLGVGKRQPVPQTRKVAAHTPVKEELTEHRSGPQIPLSPTAGNGDTPAAENKPVSSLPPVGAPQSKAGSSTSDEPERSRLPNKEEFETFKRVEEMFRVHLAAHQFKRALQEIEEGMKSAGTGSVVRRYETMRQQALVTATREFRKLSDKGAWLAGEGRFKEAIDTGERFKEPVEKIVAVYRQKVENATEAETPQKKLLPEPETKEEEAETDEVTTVVPPAPVEDSLFDQAAMNDVRALVVEHKLIEESLRPLIKERKYKVAGIHAAKLVADGKVVFLKSVCENLTQDLPTIREMIDSSRAHLEKNIGKTVAWTGIEYELAEFTEGVLVFERGNQEKTVKFDALRMSDHLSFIGFRQKSSDTDLLYLAGVSFFCDGLFKRAGQCFDETRLTHPSIPYEEYMQVAREAEALKLLDELQAREEAREWREVAQLSGRFKESHASSKTFAASTAFLAQCHDGLQKEQDKLAGVVFAAAEDAEKALKERYQIKLQQLDRETKRRMTDSYTFQVQSQRQNINGQIVTSVVRLSKKEQPVELKAKRASIELVMDRINQGATVMNARIRSDLNDELERVVRKIKETENWTAKTARNLESAHSRELSQLSDRKQKVMRRIKEGGLLTEESVRKFLIGG